jgi:hypothetical protein
MINKKTQSEQVFSVKKEYTRCITVLNRTGILTILPKSKSFGVIGIDRKEYPIPTLEQVAELFAQNRALVARKVLQGFNRLELTPLALPTPILIDRLKSAILNHAAGGNIYQTKRSPSAPLISVRVNKEKQIWIWDTLSKVLDTNILIYFPQEYSSNHQGQTKKDVINNPRICAIPGWSVGLGESLPIMPQPGKGKTIGGENSSNSVILLEDIYNICRRNHIKGKAEKPWRIF